LRHWTKDHVTLAQKRPGYYKLNVDVAGLIEEGKCGIGVMVGDVDGVVVAASCRQILSLPDSEV
jgi:hypothetical protein